MLARVHILLPYALIVPEHEKYTVYAYDINGYRTRIYMPERSDRVDTHNDAENITLNGNKAFNADVLRIDFQKDDFERKLENTGENEFTCDPPVDLIKDIANDFLRRLRYVTNGSKIKLLEFPSTNWTLRYLNDDGSELDKEEGLLRGRGARKFQFSFVAVNNDIWDNIHSLQPFQPIPVWKNLLLDADSILPEVGPAIVLTFTALEVFISKNLDDIVATGKIDGSLWKWINERGPLKDPSIEEKYDFLSRYLIGKSIKEDNKMWESFKHLRKARNSFAHSGISKVNETEVTPDKAREFIVKANEVINFVKEGLAEELQWPEFKHSIEVSFTKALVKQEGNDN